jgi:hypothetical protein
MSLFLFFFLSFFLSSRSLWLGPTQTRVSIPWYFTADDIEYIVQAIEFVARKGHLFLLRYTLDWHTGTQRKHTGEKERN